MPRDKTDWIHIVTGQDAYKRFEKKLHSHWSKDAYKGLKFINLKIKSCYMLTNWMHIVTQDTYMMTDLKFEKYHVMIIRFVESMVKIYRNDLGANIA
jgi:hypothetical protein